MDYSVRTISADNDGVRIEALEWSPGREVPDLGIPLVFIPGGTGHARTYQVHGQAGAAGKLGTRLRRVLAVSRRGTGYSDAPTEGYTSADFAGDVRAAIVAAGYQRFALFGHSMGVPIGLELAIRDPVGLACLALGDAPPQYIDFKAAGTFREVLAKPFELVNWDEAFEAMPDRTVDRVADRINFDSIRDRLFAENPDGTVRFLVDKRALEQTVTESVTAKIDYGPLLPNITAPVLLIVSAVGWSPLTTEALAVYEQGVRDLTVGRLQTGHDLGQGSNPSSFHALLGRFLDRADGVRGSGH